MNGAQTIEDALISNLLKLQVQVFHLMLRALYRGLARGSGGCSRSTWHRRRVPTLPTTTISRAILYSLYFDSEKDYSCANLTDHD
ncbi:MAG: hypothetical protein CFH05_00758 [Alphaproteobacteria bacterium MarineAlpha3_Bin4]|nr:MAG: hypothetical protein CFH05_00758 [Alphaproteobacteria bacterium MarineAlpha3_Bin4]